MMEFIRVVTVRIQYYEYTEIDFIFTNTLDIWNKCMQNSFDSTSIRIYIDWVMIWEIRQFFEIFVVAYFFLLQLARFVMYILILKYNLYKRTDEEKTLRIFSI